MSASFGDSHDLESPGKKYKKNAILTDLHHAKNISSSFDTES